MKTKHNLYTILCVVLAASSVYITTNIQWKQFLIEKGYAHFNSKTGNWELCDPDIVLFNMADPVLSSSQKITAKSYMIGLENNVKSLQEQADQDSKNIYLLEKKLSQYEKTSKK